MLDMKLVRENPEIIRKMLEDRQNDFPLEKLITLDRERRELLAEVEKLKARRNEGSRSIGSGEISDEERNTLRKEMKRIGLDIKEMDVRIGQVDKSLEDLMLQLPNIPHASVPLGPDESANVEISRWGTPSTFDFDPRPHWEIGEMIGALDFERGAKLSGSRFTVLTGPGARMERALLNFMLDLHTEEHGFREIMPPLLVNSDTMTGTGQLPKFAEDLYRCSDDLWLIPTSEVPLTNLHAGEIMKEEELPHYLTAYTPCFRREAGAHGRDVRGILRQHQFDKVELVKICTPETSYDELEHLKGCASKVLERLGLPYRTVCLSSGDMGFGAAKTYDLEVWLPSQDKYREISSCSNCGDFQARRMNARYRPSGGGKTRFVHTLNGSGIAIGRCLLAIMENYQNADGSVRVPDALVPYMGGVTLLEAI